MTLYNPENSRLPEQRAEMEHPRGRDVERADAPERHHEWERDFEEQDARGEEAGQRVVVGEPHAEVTQRGALAAHAAPCERPLHVVGEDPVEPRRPQQVGPRPGVAGFVHEALAVGERRGENGCDRVAADRAIAPRVARAPLRAARARRCRR